MLLAGLFKVPVPDLVQGLVVNLLNWLLGTGDDRIETTYHVIPAEQLRSYGHGEPHLFVGDRMKLVPVPGPGIESWGYKMTPASP